jgi:hypothetical protein
MAYTVIVFQARNVSLQDLYSFKINFPSRELSVEYRNDSGGYTIHGMNLNGQQYHHLLKLASPQKLEYFRGRKWTEEAEQKWITYEPNVWKMEISSDDGLALLVLEHGYEPCEAPKVIVDLVEYVMQIGTFGNYTFGLF